MTKMKCDACGYLIDTPNHDMGCRKGTHLRWTVLGQTLDGVWYAWARFHSKTDAEDRCRNLKDAGVPHRLQPTGDCPACEGTLCEADQPHGVCLV